LTLTLKLTTFMMGCILMADAQAAELVLHESEVTVSTVEPLEIEFTVPDGWERVYLSFDGRLVNPDERWRGGSMPCASYWVNDSPLLGDDIASMEDAKDTPLWSGEFFSWLGESVSWRLTYSPDFEPFRAANTPAEMGEYPYAHVFDITDHVVRGETNRLVIRQAMPHYDSFLVIFQGIKLLNEYERPAGVEIPRDVPDTAGRQIAPETRHRVDYQARLLDDGAIAVEVAGERWLVQSRYSQPGGGFNRLARTPDAWNPEVIGDDLRASCEQYALERTMECGDERIEVRDRLTNLTDAVLGIRLGNEVAIAKGELDRTYMSGVRVPLKEGTESIDVHPLENPTIYLTREGSGIGLLPRDNVLRAHVEMRMRDGAYGIHDRHFALAPGASYELVWDIYPTDVADYYAFINAARRALDANYLIDGNMVIAHGFEGNMEDLSDDDIRTLVEANNARYIVLSTISRLDEKGDRLPPEGLSGYAHGTALLGENGRWNRHWLERTIERFRAVVPEVKLLPYLDPWVSSEPGADLKYPDSLALGRDGLPQLYTDHEMFVLYPTAENSYGGALQEAFDWLVEVADGIYVDESTMTHNPVAGAFSYRPDTWDEHSCQMDLGSGEDEDGATYEVLRTVTSSALYTLDYRVAWLEQVRRAGKAVWMNFEPMAEEEVALQSYRFVESYSNTASVYSHLGSPCSLANEHREQDETDIGASVRHMLLSGGLYLTYGIKYHTGDNVLQDLYPIHPVELHCGYVIGKDKIVTCASGTYGFGDGARLEARIYDSSGFRLPNRDFSVAAGDEPTWAEVELSDGELAIVFRGGAG